MALENIMNSNDLFDLCITSLPETMDVIPNDTIYSHYIQPILRRIDLYKNKERL